MKQLDTARKSLLRLIQTEKELIQTENELIQTENELIQTKYELIQTKYDSVVSDKIADIRKKVAKSFKGKFMDDYVQNLDRVALISDSDYISFIDKFWLQVMSELPTDTSVMVRFMFKMEDTSGRTLTKTEFVKNTPESLNNFKQLVLYNLNNIYSHYITHDEENNISGFIMRYRVLKGIVKETVSKKLINIKKSRTQRTVKIGNLNYPLSTNIIDFGDVTSMRGDTQIVFNSNKNIRFEFDRNEDLQIIKVFKDNKLINTLTDTFIDLDSNLFKRVCNNIAYYIKDGKVICKTKGYYPKFIDQIQKDNSFTNSLFTGDIETFTKVDEKGNRYFEPYSLAYFNGKVAKIYYVTEHSDWVDMMHRYWQDFFDWNLKFKI